MEYILSTGRLVMLLYGQAISVECPHRRRGDLVGDAADVNVVLRRHVEEVAGRGFGNDQRMPRRTRHDVEEGEDMRVLINLVAGQLAAQDSCEDVVRIVSGHVGS